MKTRRKWMVAGIAIVAAVAALPCRADLVISTGVGGYSGPRMQRYSNTGADLGAFGSMGSETLDALTSTPDGHVYPVGNTLGGGNLYHFDEAGTLVSMKFSSSVVGLPSGVAVGAGFLFVGSTHFSNFFPDTITGVLEFDATTLAYLGNPLPMPTPSGSPWCAQQDLAFGDDGRLYVADQQSVSRYRVTRIGLLLHDTTFSIAATGNIAVHAGSIFLSDGNKIDRYDTAGAFQGTFVAAGAGGLQTINDYVFGDDGGLYITSSGPRGGDYWPGPSQLMRFDAATGAFQQQLLYEPGSTEYSPQLGLITYVPEPASTALLVLAAAGLLARRLLPERA